MTQYKDENGREVPTEYGGYGGRNRRTPTGRQVPLTTGQLAEDMRREGINQRATEADPNRPSYGRQTGRHRY